MNGIARMIGCRYFRYEDNGDSSVKITDLLKVVGIQNSTTLKVKDLLGDKMFKINKSVLDDNYILLEPDGYILFSIVSLQDGIRDVIVSMFRNKDMDNAIPYCVCRQNVINAYSSMIRFQDRDSFTAKDVGMCMSIDSIPDDVDYNIMTACNGIEHASMVAIYLDDTLDIILSCLKLSKFDNVLESLFQDSLKLLSDYDRFARNEDPISKGYCRTLKTLLENNDFMYDFRRAFNITKVDIDLKGNVTEDNKLSDSAKDKLQRIYNKYILDELVIKFDKDIDIDSIVHNMIMICDINDDIYIIQFTEGKEYIEEQIRSNNKMSPTEKLEAVFKSVSGAHPMDKIFPVNI